MKTVYPPSDQASSVNHKNISKKSVSPAGGIEKNGKIKTIFHQSEENGKRISY